MQQAQSEAAAIVQRSGGLRPVDDNDNKLQDQVKADLNKLRATVVPTRPILASQDDFENGAPRPPLSLSAVRQPSCCTDSYGTHWTSRTRGSPTVHHRTVARRKAAAAWHRSSCAVHAQSLR